MVGETHSNDLNWRDLMGIQGRLVRRAGMGVAATVAALAIAAPALAFTPLPPGGQVNDDQPAGIDRNLSVRGQAPTNADVVGGALTPGTVAVPWSIFGQQEAAGHKDQVFSRSFARGAWTTRGSGTVGGRSSAGPVFSGSLNFDQGQDGQAPAIDFAGAGRTVPWATWYENTVNVGVGTGFENNNVFASRFDNTGDANQGKWIFAGQNRGTGGGAVPVPSLNLHTNQSAENPAVAGGPAGDPATPGPWVTWQETGANPPGTGKNQIFVEKPIGPGAANCVGVTPAALDPAAAPVGGVCWQQVGVERLGTDPSLNIDRTRDGVEPDLAFAGPDDAVPWVVWDEQNASGDGLQNNDMVFAAEGVAPSASAPPAGTVDGGVDWLSVGGAGQGVLDNSAPGGFCGQSPANEAACSLNNDPKATAQDPRVAAGTMNPGNPTVPWVTWDETSGGHQQVFVSRLIGTGAGAHFALVNNSAPISVGANDSTRPDITFSGNTPYVTWREDLGGGVVKAFVGHFVDAANPTFVLDESDVPLTATAQADVREPISSSCTANPFNADGAACQGAASGTPFFLFTAGTAPLGLFADAYQPAPPVTAAASAVTGSSATASGSVDPDGASVNVSFQFGTSTAYGQSTPVQKLRPDTNADGFTGTLTGLPAGTVIHYRAVAASDFGTFTGADAILTTASPAPAPIPTRAPGAASLGHVTVHRTTATAPVTCTGATSCLVSLRLTVRETLLGHRVVAVSAGATKRGKRTHRLAVVGSRTATVGPGKSPKLKVSLNRSGRGLLTARHRLTATLTVSQRRSGKTIVVSHRKVTFTSPHKRRRHR
jgi:hypothetical protein